MIKRLLTTGGLVALFSLAPASLALAAGGQGQPNQDCVDVVNSGGTEPGNGHAAASPGSPFNEADLGGTGGTGGFHYDQAGAPSQYDVACYQVTQHRR